MLAAFAVVQAHSGTAQPAASPAARLAPQPLPATEALFRRYVAEDRTPGLVGAFASGDLPTRFVAAGRISDDGSAAAAGPDTLWRIYSMTKPVTGIAAMILVEEGKLALDQPIADFIPTFREMRVLTDPQRSLASRPAARPITVRHLLTHTAGLGYSIVSTGPLQREYERLGLLPLAISTAVEAQAREVRPASLAEFANRAARVPLIADPGTVWSYSIGLDVLGRVIEVAGGMPFERFLQTRLFAPLGMRSTFFTVPAGEVGRFATNYAWVGDNRVPLDPAARSVFLTRPSFPYGGAGLVSSARDYDRFLHMLQNGGTLDGVRILKAETVALAMSNLLPAGVRMGADAVAAAGGAATDAVGFGAGGSVTLTGASRGRFGWSGAAGTFAWVDPVARRRGTVMVNYFPPARWPLRADVAGALQGDWAAAR